MPITLRIRVTCRTPSDSGDTYHADVARLPILEYRDYYDLPRLILVAAADRFLLLDCPFDEAADDYPTDYAVYELASDPRESFGPDWRLLSATGRLLGRVPVASIRFDPAHRYAIESDGLETLLK